ncbi:rhomboid family intramembrane serine protease [Bhargavaea massiliensis]|uniref:rhomboid family intramembrane serine protease n=1 Tax=Bhargavaea massiliensis TaxID=2697500 RepID=UPI001BCD3407|nr:rhomboid family intramembrane serine protease [Bhargavaea massiliensis]
MFIRRESFSEYIRFYPVVSALIAINVIIYILTILPGIGDLIMFYGMGINRLIAEGDWWRFVTPMFLHAGLMHVLFNMFALFLFGPELERLAGKVRFLNLFFLAGLFGNVASYFLHDGSYAYVGASGAIYGIFGAFGAFVYHTKGAFPQIRQIILPIIVISVVMTFLTPNINVTAHLTGLAVGFLVGLSYFHPKNITSWRKKRR